MRTYVAFALIFGASFTVSAQSLFMPRDITAAYKKESRSPDGKPGKNYWQNHARYSISVTAAPPDRTIKGMEQIIYTNNSADTLSNIITRLTINIHKPEALRYQDVTPDYLTDGIHIDYFTVDGTVKNWAEPTSHFTWQYFQLDKPLAPGDSIHLAFNWHYTISLKSNREGMIDSTTFFLAYFYPRISVYDDYNGWDVSDFTDQQEFYSDFNDYDFSVTVPKNYIVWATGTLLNPSEVLQPAVADKLAASMQTDSILHLASQTDLTSKNITTQNNTNTWKWKASNIPDVTIGISDHFLWDASSVLVDDKTGRRASVQSAYDLKSKDFVHVVEYGRHSLDWFSHNWPGVPYPYEKTTIFRGFADMEYPMMVNDNSAADLNFTRFVEEHEIAHTYFPFYMGINEGRYAFMDEGWATTLEFLIGQVDLTKPRAENFFKRFRINPWISDISQEEDIPVITPAFVLRNASYGNNAYGKPALAYLAMKDMLGDDLFKKCLHAYMDRWHGKHPIPWDFFNTFNNISGKNLNWFWNNWFFTTNYTDLAISHVTKTATGVNVDIKNVGGFVSPVGIVVTYADKTTETFHQTPEIWAKDQKETTISIKTGKAVSSIVLDAGIFVDANEKDNKWSQ